jgi:SAM-dependent methyltransferase
LIQYKEKGIEFMAQNRWHQDWFDEDYLALYAHRSGEEAEAFIQFLEEHCGLKSKAAAPLRIADLGCGAGRHAIALSKRGHQVLALDWSGHLLREARKQSRRLPKENRPTLIRGDLHQLPFRAGFDWALSLFTSFGYSQSDRVNREQLLQLSCLLEPGGQAIIDFLNPAFVRNTLVERSERQVGRLFVSEKRCILDELDMVEKTMRIEKEDGSVREVVERVKLYDAGWFQSGLPDFRLLAHFGESDGSPFNEESSRSILLLERVK